ncbi:hypothetical protein TESG_00411 [Trichophyton tonsurans CBS 112818]|uniref:Uncharacterized protein n=1 Tax=Trichophyton tonsurans (strain CBS 112818) TaxID=647933 RepID=F2RNE7_TRIT1|nr:hypothetical protein TESG_00411 [Trichophyton tonsurans CBS 112818]
MSPGEKVAGHREFPDLDIRTHLPIGKIMCRQTTLSLKANDNDNANSNVASSTSGSPPASPVKITTLLVVVPVPDGYTLSPFLARFELRDRRHAPMYRISYQIAHNNARRFPPQSLSPLSQPREKYTEYLVDSYAFLSKRGDFVSRDEEDSQLDTLTEHSARMFCSHPSMEDVSWNTNLPV